MRYILKKSEIIRTRKDFQTILKYGKKIDGKYLRCTVLINSHHILSGKPRVAFGVAVPRTIRKAVDRNRIKRLIRESYRLNGWRFTGPTSQDSSSIALLFIYSRGSTKQSTIATFQDIDCDMKEILRQIGAGKF